MKKRVKYIACYIFGGDAHVCQACWLSDQAGVSDESGTAECNFQ